MTYRERRERRADRLRGWAEKREARSRKAFDGARILADSIPFGQPILVGHHSERHARRDQDRIHSGMTRGIEHQDKAREMSSKAAEIDRQAEVAIYSDDVDAVERLREKIAGLEAKRARIKVVNALVRKVGLAAAGDQLTAEERAELLQLVRIVPYHHCETRGFPAYALTNLGGNISRLKARLVDLETRATLRARVDAMIASEKAYEGAV